jgi:hypothetical protein
MNEIPPRFGLPLDLPRKERDPEAEKIHTDKDASAVALEQIKRHIDDGRAVVAGVSEPTNPEAEKIHTDKDASAVARPD